MLPEVLVSLYLEYKRDTDSIASWLASTARTAGFDPSRLSGAAPAKAGGAAAAAATAGRLKGKARKEAKKQAADKDAPKPAASSGYKIGIPDFTALAEYLLEKAVAVPKSFQDTLDRAIKVRAGCGEKLSKHGSHVDPEADARHENFTDVLKHVRAILSPLMPKPADIAEPSAEKEKLPNRFAGLSVSEPSEGFLSAPDVEIKRPDKPDSDPVTVTFAADPAVSLEEATLAMFLLLNDLRNIRFYLEVIWYDYLIGDKDLVAVSITTNTIVEFVGNMVQDIMPLMESHGGIFNILTECFKIRCREDNHCEDAIDYSLEFTFDETYYIADETFMGPYCVLSTFLPGIKPSNIAVNSDAKFPQPDPFEDDEEKTGEELFHDDRMRLILYLSDLMTVVRGVPSFPALDEALRGMDEMCRKKTIPFSLVFACQIFLDIGRILGPDIEVAYNTFERHTAFMQADLKKYINYHDATKRPSWVKACEKTAQTLHDDIAKTRTDPVLKYQTGARKHRLFKMSPVITGLALYHYRVRYRDLGIKVCNSYDSVQAAHHLYNASNLCKLLPSPWVDMDKALELLGADSFYAGGLVADNMDDQFRKFGLQMGISAVAMANGRRKSGVLLSKTGRRNLNFTAPVSSMFGQRFVNEADMHLTVDKIQKIIEVGTYTTDVNDETGKISVDQIVDPKVLQEKKRLRLELEGRAKHKRKRDAPAWGPGKRVSLALMTEMLCDAIDAETVELSFPYLMLHRRCWEMFRSVHKDCDRVIRLIIGPDYDMNEYELPQLVGYILMLATGNETFNPDPGPLLLAANSINEMLKKGGGDFVSETAMKGILEIGVEFEDGEDEEDEEDEEDDDEETSEADNKLIEDRQVDDKEADEEKLDDKGHTK